jgi:hypothetical protein
MSAYCAEMQLPVISTRLIQPFVAGGNANAIKLTALKPTCNHTPRKLPAEVSGD